MTRLKWIAGGAVAALLVLPVAADRVAAEVLEHRLASRLACVAALPTAPDVTVGGFPVLNQLAAGRLDEVRVSAADVTVSRMTLRRVSVVARDLALSGGLTAGSLTADATVDWAAVGRLGGAARIAGADDGGRLVLEAEVPVRGITLPATVYAEIALSGDALIVTPAEIELSALGVRLPAERLPAAARQSRRIDLPALPAGVAYERVSATSDGLTVTVTANQKITAGGGAGRNQTCGGKE